MLFKINSNLMHSLNGALPLPFVSELVTRGAYGCLYRRILAVEQFFLPQDIYAPLSISMERA